MTAGPCILVFGISGVGKTTACTNFASQNPEYLHYRASALLSAAKAETAEDLRTSSPGQIQANQDLLGAKLASLRRGQLERPVLIESHGVIDNDNELVVVPASAVRALLPTAFILLEAAPKIILARRASDKRRVRPRRSELEILDELAAERDTVIGFSRILGVPMEIVDVSAQFDLTPFIEKLLEDVTRSPDRQD